MPRPRPDRRLRPSPRFRFKIRYSNPRTADTTSVIPNGLQDFELQRVIWHHDRASERCDGLHQRLRKFPHGFAGGQHRHGDVFGRDVLLSLDRRCGKPLYLGASTGTGLTIACSTGVANSNIVPAAASHLYFATQPATNASTLAGASFTTQPVVQIQDTFGNVRTGDTTSVILTAYKTSNCNGSSGTTTSQASDATGYINAVGSLRTASQAASLGISTFSGVTYTLPSTNTSETLYLGASTAGGPSPSRVPPGGREFKRRPGGR